MNLPSKYYYFVNDGYHDVIEFQKVMTEGKYEYKIIKAKQSKSNIEFGTNTGEGRLITLFKWSIKDETAYFPYDNLDDALERFYLDIL